MQVHTNYNIYTPLKTNKPIHFNGLNVRHLSKSSSQNKYLKNVSARYSHIINYDKEKIYQLLADKSERNVSFFNALVNRYNSQNYMLSGNLAENNEHLINVFNTVKKPGNYHFYIIEKLDGSFEYLQKIFSLTGDKKSMKFVKDFITKIPDKNEKLLLNILQSPNKKHFINNFDNYNSYFILNRQNEDAVKILDNLIKNNKYNKNLYDVKLAINKSLTNNELPTNKVLNEQTLMLSYSPEKLSLFKTFFNTYLYNKSILPEEAYNDIINIYNSTNKHNIKFRENALKLFRYSSEDIYNKTFDLSEIKSLTNLLNYADTDKYVKSFINKIIKSNIDIHKAKDVMDILKVIPAQKADIFFDNFAQIVSLTRGEDRYNALLNDIKNPFFAKQIRTKQYKRTGYKPYYTSSIFDDIKSYAINKWNLLRYNISFSKDFDITKTPDSMRELSTKTAIKEPGYDKTKVLIPREKSLVPIAAPSVLEIAVKNISHPISAPVKLPKMDKLLKPEPHINTKILPRTTKKQTNIPREKSLTIVQKPIILQKTLGAITSNGKVLPGAMHKEELLRFLPVKKSFKELREAKKLQVISDVNNIIAKKLGAKTLDKQKAEYEKQATKIRLSLLPEIFDSIKASRQLERDLGTKRPSISNQDAVKLYNKINGNNRKLVRYMLLKTTSKTNDTRVFTIKDILRVLDKAEEEIPIYKTIEPTYKPRTYYNEIFDKYIEQYGKLTRRRNIRTKKHLLEKYSYNSR